MARMLSFVLILSLLFGTTIVLADSDKGSYYGGTVATIKDAKKEIKGHLVTKDETHFEFV